MSENGQLIYGFVCINRVTDDTRIDWDDGRDERLRYVENKGVTLVSKVCTWFNFNYS